MLFLISFICHTYHRILSFTDMRKACSRDINKKSVIPLAHPVRPEDVD